MVEPDSSRSRTVSIPRFDGAPRVSIVMVTFGTGAIVLDALDAIAANTSVPYEVIVVDNPTAVPIDSPDDHTPALLQRCVVGASVVVAERNLGFAGGNNLGVGRATGEFVCLLNPDVLVGPGWLEPLLAALDDPAVGIAAPVLLNPDRSLQEAGQLLYDDGCTAAIGGPEVLTGDWSQAFSRDVDYSSAACWLLRRTEFLELEGFDERYHPAYFEDVDYALRVEASGRRTRLVADVPVVHQHGASGGSDGAELGRRAQQTFRSIWSRRLTEQPTRPVDDVTAIRNRDRLVAEFRGWTSPSDSSSVYARRAALVHAVEDARRHPRDRVVFVTDSDAGLDVTAARSAGVELVIGDIDEHVAARPMVTEWVGVSTTSSSSLRGSVRALWSPLTAAALVLGLLVRLVMLRSTPGLLTADEAYTGIQSFAILDGHLPVVLGGTVYTLPLESYLYAPIAAVIGTNVIVLKLISTLSWALASIVLYLVGSTVWSRRVGVIAGLFCWFTPGALLILSVTAYAAYASGLLVTVVAFLLAARLVDSSHPHIARAGAFGVAAGFGFWLHPMFLASLVPMVAFVFWHHHRSLVVWVGVIVGGIMGCLPLLAWNALNGWPSLESPVPVPGTYTERLTTFGRDLMPRAFGLRNSGLEWQPNGVVGPVLYAVLIALVVVGLVVTIRASSPPSRILLPVVILGVYPIMAVFPNLILADDGRYGVISFPFLLLSVAVAVDSIARWKPSVGNLVLGTVAAAWVVGLIVPTVAPMLDDGGAPNGRLDEIETILDDAGITRVYGSYWASLPVEFMGDRRIVGGVFGFWPIRFPERQREVEATPWEEVAVVFLVDDENPGLLPLPPDSYGRSVHDDIVLYVPLTAN